MKLACHYAGIDTPRFVQASGPGDAAAIAAALTFPLLVKHPQSYGSIGMTRESRVTDADALGREIARMCASYGGALVEEFIEGREFTVLVSEPKEGETEPQSYMPVEVRFPEGETFKHFALKWIDFRAMAWVPVEDEELADRLRDVSSRTFAAIGGVGYGRCDLRMGADGRIHVLEINPNCALFLPAGEFGSADEILALDPGGHRAFTDHILGAAMRRRDGRIPRTAVRYHPSRGWGVCASRDIPAGEVVHRHEEGPHHLVSRAHAERTWDAVHLRWLAQYAWPLTDDLCVMWSNRPADWRPIDHSCDPNAWLLGLDLVARRTIRRGEPVTMDYATFCGPGMENFRCRCGSPLCRGTIRGSDHLLPDVGERYDGHLSDWVRRARANFAARRGRRRNVACSTSRNTT
jgi:D-alanine-D-alanine ligase